MVMTFTQEQIDRFGTVLNDTSFAEDLYPLIICHKLGIFPANPLKLDSELSLYYGISAAICQ
uniref:DUF4158 domain-containing protein n=1 Tax=Haemonchus placei TaxID=6290 RepID=A0A0N4WP25_HAEPC